MRFSVGIWLNLFQNKINETSFCFCFYPRRAFLVKTLLLYFCSNLSIYLGIVIIFIVYQFKMMTRKDNKKPARVISGKKVTPHQYSNSSARRLNY